MDDHPAKILSSEKQPDDGGGDQKSRPEERPPSTSRKRPGLLDLPPELIKIIYSYLRCYERAQLSDVCVALSNFYNSIPSLPCINGPKFHEYKCHCEDLEVFVDTQSRKFYVYREHRPRQEPIWHHVYINKYSSCCNYHHDSKRGRTFIRTGRYRLRLVSPDAARSRRIIREHGVPSETKTTKNDDVIYREKLPCDYQDRKDTECKAIIDRLEFDILMLRLKIISMSIRKLLVDIEKCRIYSTWRLSNY